MGTKNRILSLVLSKPAKTTLFVFALLGTFLAVSPAALALDGAWVNASEIDIGGIKYFDGKVDNKHRYDEIGGTDGCSDQLDHVYDDDGAGGTLYKKSIVSGTSDCSDTSQEDLVLSNTGARYTFFKWTDADTIKNSDEKITYVKDKNDGIFYHSAGKCKNSLTVAANGSLTLIERGENYVDSDYEDGLFGKGGISSKNFTKIGDTSCYAADPIPGLPISGSPTTPNPGFVTGGGGSSGFAADSCEESAGFFGIIVCPLLEGLDSGFSWLDDKIVSSLTVSEEYLTERCPGGGNSCQPSEKKNAVRDAWSNIRNVAYILLIPVMLVMVIGTALGFGFVDAYTVKRAMPRLLIAIIFIALSYNICVIMVQVTNEVGRGTAGLIAQPFGGSQELTLRKIFASDTSSTLGVGAGAAAGVTATGFLLGVGLWSVIGSAVISLLATFFIPIILILVVTYALLLIRQLLIITAIIFAPLAIISWIFPGNDKLWKLWWGTFSKMLYVFPVIMAFLMVGRGFASIVGGVDEGPTLTILKGIAFVGPYFFIPKAFALAGGALGNVAGMANDRSRGVFDKAKKKRGAIKDDAMQRGITDPLTQRRSNITKKLETAASNNKLGGKKGYIARKAIGLGARGVGGQNIEARMSELNARRGKEVNDAIATGDDERFRALSAMDAMEAFNKDAKAAEDAGLSRNNNGTRQFKSLGGQWVNQQAVVAAKAQYGSDHAAQQAVLAYEMKKAVTSEQKAGLVQRYGGLSKSWDMTDKEAGGAWIGAAFQNQNEHLEYKSMSVNGAGGNRSMGFNGAKLAEEIFERKGTYPLSQLSGGSIEQLRFAHSEAKRVASDTSATAEDRGNANATLIHMRGIAENLVSRGSAGGVGAVNVGTADAPDMRNVSAGGSAEGGVQTMGQGSAHTNQEIRKFVEEVGQYTPTMPPGTTPTK